MKQYYWIWVLLDVKNYADLGVCYSPLPKHPSSDLHNSYSALSKYLLIIVMIKPLSLSCHYQY